MKVRLAVIGLNHGLKVAQRAQTLSDVSLVAVCAPARAENRSRARQLGVPLYHDIEGLLRAEALDGVIVATPTHDLVRAGMRCARSGIHVLVEKPMAATIDEAEALVAATQEEKVHLLVGYHRRFSPRVVKLRRLLAEGRLGRLLGVVCLWTTLKPARYFQTSWRTIERCGGGPLMINAVHELDLLRFICGEVRAVSAMVAKPRRFPEIEDTVSISFEFESGAVGNLFVSDRPRWPPQTPPVVAGSNSPTFAGAGRATVVRV